MLKGSELSLIQKFGYGWYASFHVNGDSLEAMKRLVDELKDADIGVDIDKWRNKRSLSANAYFHALCDKLAKAMKTSADEMKALLVMKYGTIGRASDGKLSAVKVPDTVDIDEYYPYTRLFGKSEQDGVTFNHYFLLKRTHTLDTAEMARLIDGTISDCKEQGIETLPPDEVERMMVTYAKNKTREST